MIQLEGSVKRKYVSGKGVYGAADRIESEGFGSLWEYPKAGSSMLIIGDHGIMTSLVQDVTEQDDGSVLVKTINSVYEVSKR